MNKKVILDITRLQLGVQGLRQSNWDPDPSRSSRRNRVATYIQLWTPSHCAGVDGFGRTTSTLPCDITCGNLVRDLVDVLETPKV